MEYKKWKKSKWWVSQIPHFTDGQPEVPKEKKFAQIMQLATGKVRVRKKFGFWSLRVFYVHSEMSG